MDKKDIKNYKVVPLCKNQLKDIRESDIVEDGKYRLCNTYRGGGGYDKFPSIAKKRLNIDAYYQFVVQLKGCTLKCPYCYVTYEGINGKSIPTSINELIKVFIRQNVKIFHLMGGALVLHIKFWDTLIETLNSFKNDYIFHSDFLLNEGVYTNELIKSISKPNTLYAVSLKGDTEKEYFKNTGVKVNFSDMRDNLEILYKNKTNFYITFTGFKPKNIIDYFLEKLPSSIFNNSFNIPIVSYKAINKE